MSQGRNLASRFEDLLQGIFEGIFGRVFRSRLQPVELQRKIERAMDENLVVTAGRRLAPNAYRVLVSENDFTVFQNYLRSLIMQLQDRVVLVARQRNYALTTRPVVRLEADSRLVTGEVRVDAKLLEGPDLNAFAAAQTPGVPATNLPAGAPPDGTIMIPQGQAPPVASATPAAPVGMPYAALVLRTPQGPGKTYVIDRPITHLGRKTTNDIVINDQRVSRYHAEIRYEQGEFIIYDLGSMNHVVINGAPQQRAVLRNGDVVTLGSYSFVFERR
jgi:hypothetical protein